MIARAAVFLTVFLPLAAAAAPDATNGSRLVDSAKCEACHQGKVPGPVGAIYLRKDHKVSSWAKLKAQVAACNSGLKLGLFPDDEDDISAYLNATYYKLPAK